MQMRPGPVLHLKLARFAQPQGPDRLAFAAGAGETVALYVRDLSILVRGPHAEGQEHPCRDASVANRRQDRGELAGLTVSWNERR